MLPPEPVPKPVVTQQKKKKQNMYYLNSLIYDNYLRKNYQKSLSLIRNYETTNQSKKTEFHLYMLGLIYRQLTQFDKSLNNFKQCYMMNKNNFEYLKQMTKGLFISGKYKPAMQAAKDACLLNVDQIQLSLNNLAEASKYFENSIEIEPSDEAYLQLSEIYMRLGKKDKAYSNLQEGFKFSFENSEILDEMGKISIDIGKNNQALIHFERSLQINPKDVKALLALGSILQQKAQLDQAMYKYRTMHVISPNSYELWNNVGLCMMNKNKNLAAYCCLRKAVFLDPLQWKPIANLGMICLKMKKYTLASVHFSTSLSLNPKNPQILNLLGVSLVHLNDFVNAQLAFQQGLNIERIQTKYNHSAFIYVNYFLMLLNKKDYEMGRNILDQANKRMSKQIGVEKLDIMRNYLQSAS